MLRMAGARPASLPDLSTIALQGSTDDTTFLDNPEYSLASCTDPKLTNNTRYCLVERSLEILETQLAQARRDIQTLQRTKEEALAEPDRFIRILDNERECARRFPRLQEVHFIPELPLQQYQRRFTRRGNNKFDQNLGTWPSTRLLDAFNTRIFDCADNGAAAAEAEHADGLLFGAD